MPGMGSGLSNNNPLVVAAFHRALLHEGFVVLAIVAVVAIAWNLLRSAELHRARQEGAARPGAGLEPPARRWLRIGFGLLWVFDGALQAQASMPLGLIPQVLQPAAATSPHWVQHLTNAGSTVWSYHPVAAAAATVWIQVGIGVWLLSAPRGNWSRLAGVASAAWGLVVWVFGEAFGGIFAPGLTWLFGAPGAVAFYVVASVLIALPEDVWRSRLTGRLMLGATGLFFTGMAVLQAWPGRGFWQGQGPAASIASTASATSTTPASSGTLYSMVTQMAQTRQPHVLSSWVAAFARFDGAHGWAVNLVAVIALALIGITLLLAGWIGPARARRLAFGAVLLGAVLGLADWVLIEDLGFMGGVGTDPNSMVPIILLLIGGYLALTRPASVTVAAEQTWRARLRTSPAYAFRSVAAGGALAITLVGAAPMAVAAANRTADPILTEAVDGTPTAAQAPAPAFQLTDQRGRPVSLAGLKGKTVALTFLDPVCTSDCPLIAQEFRRTDLMLGAAAAGVEFVAVNANPLYTGTEYLAAFDQVEHLDSLPNWLYLTGSAPQLRQVWRAYGEFVEVVPGGAMVDHADMAYVIDAAGRIRYTLNTDPGPGTAATTSSFATALSKAIKSA